MQSFDLFHDTRNETYRSPFGAIPTGGSVVLSLRAAEQYEFNGTLSASIHFEADTACGKLIFDVPMKKQSLLCEGHIDSVFSASVDCFDVPGVYFYYFTVCRRSALQFDAGAEILYYGNNSGKKGGLGEVSYEEPAGFQITVYEKDLTVPDWLTDAIFYQIFPDRFASSGRVNPADCGRVNGPVRTYESWDAIPYYEKDRNGDILVWDFMGGDLYGIADKLDYISGLGANAVYLNPIFEAASNHRYDTANYKKVDPVLGGDGAFDELAAAAKEKEIRLVLDGVFSHTGCDSIYFDRYGHYGGKGAYGNPDSPYRSWYRFKGHCDDEYECWWGCKALPNVNEMNPGYLSYIVEGEDSVLDHWLQKGVSGFRLDVADELPDEFIQALRRRSDGQPDGAERVLIGEVWEDASNKISYGVRRRYFTDAELHSVTNYVFRDRLTEFLTGKISSSALWSSLLSLYENYPRHNFYAALNMTGSHDVKRLFSVLLEASGADREKAWQLHLAYAAVLFTFPGVPMVYYGDETCLEGGTDPDNRRPFPWGREDSAMISAFTALARLRKEQPVLRRGFFRVATPFSDDGNLVDSVFSFERHFANGRDAFDRPIPEHLGTDSVVCVISRSPAVLTEISLSGFLPGFQYASAADGTEYTVDGNGCLHLQVRDVVILKRIMYN